MVRPFLGQRFRWRPRRRLQSGWTAVLVVLVFFLSACRVDTSVVVTVDEDGSGTVEVELVLGPEAVAAIVDLDQGLALDDMREAGWVVAESEPTFDGGLLVGASKAFATPEQFSEVMEELSGERGLFEDFELERRQGFARFDYVITGTIDTSAGLGSFSDPELNSALAIDSDDPSTNFPVSSDEIGISVLVRLPGDVTEGETNGLATVDDDGRAEIRWAADLAGEQETSMLATSELRRELALVLRGLSALAGVIAVLLLAAQLLRIFSGDDLKRNSTKQRSALVSIPSTSGDQKATSSTTEPVKGEGDAKTVILDANGVLYEEGDDINKLLIPFVKQRGSTLLASEIQDKARALSLGRLTSAAFWSEVGVVGDPVELDEAYISLHRLSPSVISYIQALRKQQVSVGCVVNGARSWSEGLRTKHGLVNLVDPWIVSGSVGVRNPDPPMLEVVRRLSGESVENIRIVNDNLDLLDSVRQQGYLTTWYSPTATKERARGHDFISSFESELRRLDPLPNWDPPPES